MAKDTSGTPMTFDAVGQEFLLGEFPGSVATPGQVGVELRVRPFVNRINIESGALGGAYEVLDKAGGRSLTGPVTLGANAFLSIEVGARVRGIFIQAFGSDGTIKVY